MDIRNVVIALLVAIVIIQLMVGRNPLANEEIIEWVDYRGNPMRVRVNRSLH